MSQGPGWWEASDGKWYPPRESEEPPAPGWWLAADGKWYPPVEDAAPAPGWWLAADGKWYPPEDHPDHRAGDRAPAEDATDRPIAAPTGSADAPAGTATAASHATDSPAFPAAAERAPRTVAQAASDAMPVRRRSIDATDQIRTRNDASRQDAIAQAPARFLAAARAVKALETELADVATVARGAAPTVADPPTAVTPAPVSPVAAAPGAGEAAVGSVPPPPPPPPAPPTLVGVPPAAAAAPLIELRTSPLGADIDHIGDRLLVFEDRVELRDRLDRVRQVLDGEEITDVVIQRKFTGAVLVVEAGNGESILTRGLRPEQAEQAKVLIHKRTRSGRPAAPRPAAEPVPAAPPSPSLPTLATTGEAAAAPPPPPAPAPAPAPPPADHGDAAAARMALLNRGRLNEADLLRKLADLHRAGVLTDIEFEDKVALVGQLVAGESLAIG